MAALFKDINIHWDTRLCEVDGETGYFHTWEQYSQPVEGSLTVGGAPAGVVSRVYGIVEFERGVRRINPDRIIFCDEEHEMLHVFNKEKEKKDAEN